MSGYRRYRRYGYRRRRYYRYRRYGLSTARKANIAYRSTRKMVKREEVKTFEAVFGDAFISPNAYMFHGIAKVERGTGESNRIGGQITPTSLRIKCRISITDSLAPIPGNFTVMCRIILFVWKGFGDPTAGQILESNSIIAHKNDQYKYNSKILYDKIHKLDSQIQMKYIPITIKKALRRYPISFDDVQSPVSYRMNGIHCMVVYDTQITAPGEVDVDIRSRLCYKDN